MAKVGCVMDEWPLGFISVVTLTWIYKKCPALLEQLMILIEVEVRSLNVGGQCQIVFFTIQSIQCKSFWK